MGGFSVGYSNNLYIGGKRNGAKLNLCLVKQQHSHQWGVGGIGQFLWFGEFSFLFCVHMHLWSGSAYVSL